MCTLLHMFLTIEVHPVPKIWEQVRAYVRAWVGVLDALGSVTRGFRSIHASRDLSSFHLVPCRHHHHHRHRDCDRQVHFALFSISYFGLAAICEWKTRGEPPIVALLVAVILPWPIYYAIVHVRSKVRLYQVWLDTLTNDEKIEFGLKKEKCANFSMIGAFVGEWTQS